MLPVVAAPVPVAAVSVADSQAASRASAAKAPSTLVFIIRLILPKGQHTAADNPSAALQPAFGRVKDIEHIFGKVAAQPRESRNPRPHGS
jgi:hypothetical protein